MASLKAHGMKLRHRALGAVEAEAAAWLASKWLESRLSPGVRTALAAAAQRTLHQGLWGGSLQKRDG